jgi:CRISPR-associated endonuclease/helicase Cas3
LIETGRRLLDVALKSIEGLSAPDRVFVIEAPTGYGKSVGAPVIAALNHEKQFSFNFIHVLPLRTIVEDLYLCKYLSALGMQSPICGDKAPPKPFCEALKSLGVSSADVAYQMGFDYMLRGVGKKEPTYDAKVVISTLDSFAYNFLRIPVTELFREVKHYATPRARILTATIFLDEVHMLNRFEDEASERVLALLKVLIEFSLETQTPLVMASATLWSAFRSSIERWSGGKVMFFTISGEDGKSGSVVHVRDREYEDLAKSVRWCTRVVDEDVLISKVMEHVESGERVLVVRDRVSDAVELYTKLSLSEREKALLHGRLCLSDREKSLEKAKSAKVVVATPVVEAGVDWDFDVAFRDATNIPSLIQVLGRVCRSRADCEGSAYLIKVSGSPKELIELASSGKYIDWRIPYSYTRGVGEEAVGYQHVLELQRAEVRESPEAEAIFRGLIAPMALPSLYINIAVQDYGYSLLKRPLAQFYVYGVQGLLKSEPESVQDVILGTFTYTYDIVEKSEKCVECFACVIKVGNALDRKLLDWRKSYFELQKSCAKSAADVKGQIIFSGFVLKPECYSEGLGLV